MERGPCGRPNLHRARSMRSDITGLWKAAARGARSADWVWATLPFAAMNAAEVRLMRGQQTGREDRRRTAPIRRYAYAMLCFSALILSWPARTEPKASRITATVPGDNSRS